MIELNENDRILFIGDSITDCGRDYENFESLGSGYVQKVGGVIDCGFSELNLELINKGISGNRVIDLKKRWKEDCIALSPDILSVYIGINDTWRKYDANNETPANEFEKIYRELLLEAKNNLDCQIVMIEPFVVPYPEDREKWREDLNPKIDAVRRLARKFADAYVPLDGIFASASCRREAKFWASDGVHPTNAGHALIADAWFKYTNLG